MGLRESVKIKTPGGDLYGELFIGADGFPELWVEYPGECQHATTESTATFHEHRFRPATFPAAWGPIVNANDERIDGLLLEAWREIEAIRQRIVAAQREAEAEDRDRAQQRESDNRLAQEIDERRAES